MNIYVIILKVILTGGIKNKRMVPVKSYIIPMSTLRDKLL